MSVTVTLYLWWLWLYLAIGVALYLPLNFIAWRHTTPRIPFFDSLRNKQFAWMWSNSKRRWRMAMAFGASVALWPLAIWEAVR